jgi:hypothetical protein
LSVRAVLVVPLAPLAALEARAVSVHCCPPITAAVVGRGSALLHLEAAAAAVRAVLEVKAALLLAATADRPTGKLAASGPPACLSTRYLTAEVLAEEAPMGRLDQPAD